MTSKRRLRWLSAQKNDSPWNKKKWELKEDGWYVEKVLYRDLNERKRSLFIPWSSNAYYVIFCKTKSAITWFPRLSVEWKWVSGALPEDEDCSNCLEAVSVTLASWRCSPCVSLTFSFCCCFRGSLKEAFSRGRSPWSYLGWSWVSTTYAKFDPHVKCFSSSLSYYWFVDF